MAFSKQFEEALQFEKALDELFKQRTHWLRLSLGLAEPGKPPKFSRKKVDRSIARLQELASKAFTSTLAKDHFDRHLASQKCWRVEGRGWRQKKTSFNKWYRTLGLKKGCVYAFWGGQGRCLYVGRTGTGGTRPSNHFEKFWFPKVKQITVYEVKGGSHIPKIECLAIHRFQPRHNRNAPAARKWKKACPLCEIHRLIENELRQIFRLR